MSPRSSDVGTGVAVSRQVPPPTFAEALAPGVQTSPPTRGAAPSVSVEYSRTASGATAPIREFGSPIRVGSPSASSACRVFFSRKAYVGGNRVNEALFRIPLAARGDPNPSAFSAAPRNESALASAAAARARRC